MTKTNMDLSELLSKHDQGDFLRTIAEAVLQLIMETDVEGLIGWRSSRMRPAICSGDQPLFSASSIADFISGWRISLR